MKPEKEMIYAYASKLKLSAVKNELEDVLAMSEQEKWSNMRLIKELLEKEYNRKIENKKGARIKAANFSQLKYLHEIVTGELPNDARAVLPELETLAFIKEGRNLVLYGNPGTGKTHIAIALGIKACREDYSVLFTSVPQLLIQIREARSAKTLKNLQSKFEKYDLVICDEFDYVSCDKEGGELLFNHLSLRAGKKSTVITTNLAFNRWDEIIKDKVLVAAMVDRLTHKAYLVDMSGQSYRFKETQKIMRKKMQ